MIRGLLSGGAYSERRKSRLNRDSGIPPLEPTRFRPRLIGVDTPETVLPQKPVEYYGKEASAFTKRLAEGQEVRLEYDQQRRDHYGRTLAYVWLSCC